MFEIPEDIAYLNCAYMSPQLRRAREIGERAVSRKSRPWELTPDDFFDEVEGVRTLFARLVGGEAEGVAVIPSVSYGISVAAANVAVREGEKIVILEDQFPSNVYPWRELASRSGARLVTVPRPEDLDWTRALLGEIDADTAVVAAPNCHWTDGSSVDLVRVGASVREAGAALVVDAIQSLGALPFDVSEVRPDFLVAAAYKWLLGPYGVGFMYVAEEHRGGNPIEHNWINRRGSEHFAQLVDYQDAFQPGARPPGGGRNPSVGRPAVASTQAIIEFEFHISPAASSSRPRTGVGTAATRSITRRATAGSVLSRRGPSTA